MLLPLEAPFSRVRSPLDGIIAPIEAASRSRPRSYRAFLVEVSLILWALDISKISDMLNFVMQPRPRRTVPSKGRPNIGRLVALFHALSDETRLAIVEKLLSGEQCVCDLTDAIGAAQPRLSFHLKVLKEAGLVSSRRDGRWIHYALVPEALGELEKFCCSAKERAGCCL